MHYPHIPTEEPGLNPEKTPQPSKPHDASFYHSLAKSANEAGQAELSQRLTVHALGLSEGSADSQDPDWVFWDPDKKQHVSPDSGFYERDRAKVREGVGSQSGYRSLDKRLVDRIASQPARRTQVIEECSEDIERCRSDWLEIISDESISWWVRDGIANELAKQGYYTWPEQFDWQNQQCVADLNEKCTIAIKALSTAEFYDFIERHTQDYREEAHKMAERFVEYDRDFQQKLNEYISNRTVPISKVRAFTLLGQSQICPLDRITRKASEGTGEYNPDDTRIHIASGQDLKAERTIYFHERLHSISGRTVLFVQTDDGGIFRRQRTGLRIEQRPNTEARWRFVWLDEAVTTELANNMSGYDENGYLDERNIKNLLLHGGKKDIPDKILIDAYFEDYEPDASEKIPAWKKFHSAITEKYGPRFLVRLDKIIQENGIAAGIDYIKLRQ